MKKVLGQVTARQEDVQNKSYFGVPYFLASGAELLATAFFGDSSRLLVTVSSRNTNESVTLEANPFGIPAMAVIGMEDTGPGGPLRPFMIEAFEAMDMERTKLEPLKPVGVQMIGPNMVVCFNRMSDAAPSPQRQYAVMAVMWANVQSR